MSASHISITEAKKRLGELVKRAAFGGERFLLDFRDKPQAAIVGHADLEKLEQLEGSASRQRDVLRQLRALRERIAARSGEKFDVVRELKEMREERLDTLTGLR
jgi:prevent-host-death family protein